MEDPDEHTAPERTEAPAKPAEPMASKQQLDAMAAIVAKIKQHLPDAEVITLRKLYRDGCTEARYAEWMDHLNQIKAGVDSIPAGNGNNKDFAEELANEPV